MYLCSRVLQCSDANKKDCAEDIKNMGIPKAKNGSEKQKFTSYGNI